jgi:hypothetical protein
MVEQLCHKANQLIQNLLSSEVLSKRKPARQLYSRDRNRSRVNLATLQIPWWFQNHQWFRPIGVLQGYIRDGHMVHHPITCQGLF